MKLGLWNMDHPEHVDAPGALLNRFNAVRSYLTARECDVLVLLEVNVAMQLDGFTTVFSEESPFLRKGRCYLAPNRYHQVGIYSRLPLAQQAIAEPINGVLANLSLEDGGTAIYGNVITIKDQWSKSSSLRYSDRLEQQLNQMAELDGGSFIVLGDFNLRLGWPSKLSAHAALKKLVVDKNWVWPTIERTDTVQHVVHSKDLTTKIAVDHSVVPTLSDHPFVEIELSGITR